MNNEAVIEEVETERKKKEKKEKIAPRTEPIDLDEQLTLKEAKSNTGKKVKLDWNDPKYPTAEWDKKSHTREHINGTRTEVHYWENLQTGNREGYKFKDQPDNNRTRFRN